MKDVKRKVKQWVKEHDTQIKVAGGAALGVAGYVTAKRIFYKTFYKDGYIISPVKFTDGVPGFMLQKQDIFGKDHEFGEFRWPGGVGAEKFVNGLMEAIQLTVEDVKNDPTWIEF